LVQQVRRVEEDDSRDVCQEIRGSQDPQDAERPEASHDAPPEDAALRACAGSALAIPALLRHGRTVAAASAAATVCRHDGASHHHDR